MEYVIIEKVMCALLFCIIPLYMILFFSYPHIVFLRETTVQHKQFSTTCIKYEFMYRCDS